MGQDRTNPFAAARGDMSASLGDAAFCLITSNTSFLFATGFYSGE